jgi:anti-anti-sigma factor
MPDGRVTHSHKDDVHVLHYSGRVDYTLAPALQRYLDRLFEGAPVGGFVFDLREASLLDSTNLGLLARVAERVRACCGRRCALVSTSDDITDVLRSMGFEEIFDIVADDPAIKGAPDEEIAIERPSQDDLMRTMLEAHRTLVTLNDKDREKFQDVVMWLESEMHTH